MTRTQEHARNLARDPMSQLLALATRHAGAGLQMSARSYIAEGCYLLESGESPYYARRAWLEAIKLRAGPNHPDYARAQALVQSIEATQ